MQEVKLYTFKKGETEGSPAMNEKLGGKGANLCGMASLGINVPAGVIIPTDYCNKYHNAGGFLRMKLASSVSKTFWDMHQDFFGKKNWPLMSIRSGARVSMPGMMDTVLNVGITKNNIDYYVKQLGAKTAYDCYRRLIQMYGNVVHGVDMDLFENKLTEIKSYYGVEHDSELDADALMHVVKEFLKIYEGFVGKAFPVTSGTQVKNAVKAVWDSWNCDRAKHYRKMHGYPDDWGTAVIIQAMVFGNTNDDSGSGVLFTRSPVTGNDELFGEFLVNAQGEDVVSGVRTPQDLSEMAKWNPAITAELADVGKKLETVYRDMQDIEFTIQNGELFILQTRNGKRSSEAAFKIVYDLLQTKSITVDEAKGRLTISDYTNASKAKIANGFNDEPIATGIPAGGGVVSGLVAMSSEAAVACDGNCILVRKETTPDDIAGMEASIGILTSTGGMTSHAAVVARGMNKSCVVGAIELSINEDGKVFTVLVGDKILTISEGDLITIDGEEGRIWIGEVPIIKDTPKEVSQVVEIIGGDSLSEGLVFKGRKKDDIIGQQILIPYSWYGPSRKEEFVADIKAAIDAGLKVFVSLDEKLDDNDAKIFGLFGLTGPLFDKDALTTYLVSAGVYDSVEIFTEGAIPTLEDMLTGRVAELGQDDILRICGSDKAYELLKGLLDKSGVEFNGQPSVSSKLALLKTIFKGE